MKNYGVEWRSKIYRKYQWRLRLPWIKYILIYSSRLIWWTPVLLWFPLLDRSLGEMGVLCLHAFHLWPFHVLWCYKAPRTFVAPQRHFKIKYLPQEMSALAATPHALEMPLETCTLHSTDMLKWWQACQAMQSESSRWPTQISHKASSFNATLTIDDKGIQHVNITATTVSRR